MVKLTPGPGDYENIIATDSAVVKKSFNYQLNNGGIPVPFLKQTPKEHLIENSFKIINKKGSHPKLRQTSALSKKSEQGYGKGIAYETNKIQENIMHVKNANTYILNSTTGNFSQLTGNETVDVQASVNAHPKHIQKYANETMDNQSDNLTQSLTKYSKNVDNTTEFGGNIINPPLINKKSKGKK